MEFQDAVQQILDRGAEAIGVGIALKDIDDEFYAISETELSYYPIESRIKEQISKGGELIGTLETNPIYSNLSESFIKGVLALMKLEILELI
jgi:hypothetical protein